MLKKKTNSSANLDTEARLLKAAGEIFAEHGYQAATTRQICEKARANIAAINYHFGDKEGLYLAVLRSVPKAYAEKYPAAAGIGAGAPPEEKLRRYIASLLSRIFDRGRPAWHAKLIAREMIEPTRAFDALMEEAARPVHEELASIVRELLGPMATTEVTRLCTLSIISQCVYYHHARSVIQRLYPAQSHGPEEIDALAEHIGRFSLAGLREYARQRNGAEAAAHD
jgi:AcrR family transcriptional regulator